MTNELWLSHPGFDTLSAHADDTSADAPRSRVGRHVALCDRCRGIVEEIRALGEAVRATGEAHAPAGLWGRIDASASRVRAAATPTLLVRISSASGPRDSASRPAPRGTQSRRMLIGAGLVAAAAAAAVVAWPRRASLEAAGTSRLTFSPARPAPGGRLTVRYQPAAWMSPNPSLVLVGRLAMGAGAQASAIGGEVFAGLGDSLATLTRAPDGAYLATFTLPRTFLALGLTVLDLEQDELDADGAYPWIVVGGTATRQPSYAAFVAAREIAPVWFSAASRLRPRQSVNVADSLKRYFPHHPAGWAYAPASRASNGTFDMFRFFQSGERKYAAMYERLWPAKGLDADHLHHMTLFANAIQEPGEALRWSARFVEEHPEDPRSLGDLATALHAMELREPPALRDSIRSWLPMLDRAYRAAPVPNLAFHDALRLAQRFGDSATRTLWNNREAANARNRHILLMAHGVSAARPRSAVSGEVEQELRKRASQQCELPAGRLPLGETRSGWRVRCERYRGMAYSALATASIRDGDPRRAQGDADSALAAMSRGDVCAPSRGYVERARARLALGDTTAAAADFEFAAAGYPSRVTTMADTARAALGSRFDGEQFAAGAEKAQRAAAACLQAQRVRAKAREERMRGPGAS